MLYVSASLLIYTASAAVSAERVLWKFSDGCEKQTPKRTKKKFIENIERDNEVKIEE